MQSKESKIVELFFNATLKEWRFKEIQQEIDIADSKLSRWLDILEKETVIKRIKKKGAMPYYLANIESHQYWSRKWLYGMNMLMNSGLFRDLRKIKKAKLILLYGSFASGDWHNDSDIDVFIFGDTVSHRIISEYSEKLGRNIHVLSAKTWKDVLRIPPGLMASIYAGHVIKGDRGIFAAETTIEPGLPLLRRTARAMLHSESIDKESFRPHTPVT